MPGAASVRMSTVSDSVSNASGFNSIQPSSRSVGSLIVPMTYNIQGIDEQDETAF